MAEEEMVNAEQAEQPGGLSVVVTTPDDSIRVVTAAGEIDHHTGDTLRQALEVSDTLSPRVVVELSQVTFMDSSGINVLLAARRALSEAGGCLRLAAAADSVLRTLQLVGLDTIIDCHETLHQALSN
ncbi:STAS domain-containing protein [Streptomyces echinatus]|uniref:STAS domain-containing protein n=1 Tax=Streptomyces echinatus TaxID=67293 RepID=UPI0037AE9EA7